MLVTGRGEDQGGNQPKPREGGSQYGEPNTNTITNTNTKTNTNTNTNRRWEPVWRVLEAENRRIREGNARRREQGEGRQPTADGL